jgi:ribosomal protein S18 acetylase RimI-like enzyme
VSSDLLIRAYRASDETAVIALWTACKLVVSHNNPCKDIQRKLSVNPEWFLIGERNNVIVATCMAGYEGHRGWINYLAVAPDEQRRRVASRMMQKAEELLRKAGCPKINLQIRPTNLQVIEFYKSIGFKIDEVTSMGKRLEVDEGT